jgi:molybdopterin-containing oxidoreductase family iron-sulfur binding subunit
LDELSGVTRRQFLKIMAASFALGGVGCSPEPRQRVVPHVDEPAEESPGRPIYYASALPIDGYAQGVLVATHQGRPTKLEGNPQHPLNQGAGSAMTQAEILRFYDPERSQSVHHDGRIST